MSLEKCTQCGCCCIMGTCEYGRKFTTHGETCVFLYFDDKKMAHCRAYEENNNLKEIISIGYGCLLKSMKQGFYKDMCERYLE